LSSSLGWLLLLLGCRLRLLFPRFLLFREPQPALCYLENDVALPFKGDFARKV
jgi:hypothetical protein